MKPISILSLLWLLTGCTSTERDEALTAPSTSAIKQPAVANYVIKPGDSGARIALNHAMTLSDLVALNPEVNWTALRVGQMIRIYGVSQKVPNSEVSVAP
jgi:LysM repeat protein